VVTRARLEDRLAEAHRRRLTLVTAGPGLGKTTLLSRWAHHQACAWYTVGAEDRDPAVFARGLI
jgi:ATP/maltotriose-dependent transcriptional regulator MalT